jgi:ribosome-binding ATPase YchF (GTP1/OBG family)
LLAGKLASTVVLKEEEKPMLASLHLLTAKKILYVLNKKSGGKNLDEMKDPRFEALLAFMKESKSDYVIVDAKIEEDLKEMVGEERDLFRAELGGVKDDGINDLIKAGYRMLGLITYFTTGVEETRAWTIHEGWMAPLAGTAIHTDFKDKFVRAEVIEWDKLLEAGSYGAAREKGWVRTEGKEYVVKDGDVMEFKI